LDRNKFNKRDKKNPLAVELGDFLNICLPAIVAVAH
jgi:hypothetical protein